jgi:hypothetical protein
MGEDHVMDDADDERSQLHFRGCHIRFETQHKVKVKYLHRDIIAEPPCTLPLNKPSFAAPPVRRHRCP